ncbi:hypothetical protein [Streptomyces niveus]|uniref:hypothetical protein n=1 Tax=Streptomyces niveus TaxID=193462 RepID=UPI00114D09EF|nr:hypothetical protein [Streptomyces niveus]
MGERAKDNEDQEHGAKPGVEPEVAACLVPGMPGQAEDVALLDGELAVPLDHQGLEHPPGLVSARSRLTPTAARPPPAESSATTSAPPC